MIHAPKIYAHEGIVEIPLTVDEEINGVQFDFLYGVGASFDSITFASGASGLANEVTAGHLKVAFGQAAALSNPVCTIRLAVDLSTLLVIENAIGSTLQAEDLPLQADNGEIVVGDEMNIRASWVDNNPANVNVTGYRLRMATMAVPGVPPDPSDPSAWSVVASPPAGETSVDLEITVDQGTAYFYVTIVNALGESPPSNVASIGTNLPIAAENLTVEII